MKRLLIAAAIAGMAATPAYAQTCKAVNSEGKELVGAARLSHIKKCCEESAKTNEGKPLTGAAKNSFIEKCMKG